MGVAVFLFYLILDQPFKANLGEAGIFDPYGLQAFMVGKNLLLCSSSEKVLALYGPDGQLISVFQKAGPGPEELEQPGILGVDSKHIYVFNRSKDVLCFDHNLTSSTTLPSFIAEISANFPRLGLSIGDNVFLIENIMMASRYSVFKVQFTNSQWKILDSYFPRESIFESESKEIYRRMPRLNMDSIYFYRYDVNLHVGATEYIVEVFKDTGGRNPDFILSAPIKFDIIINKIVGFVNRIGHHEGGFVVELLSKNPNNPKDPKDPQISRDYFNLLGELTKREITERSFLVPVLNNNNLMKTVLVEDDLVLIPLKI
jgi:hypothetical protein